MNDLISREKLKDDIAVLLERNDKLIDEWLANCIDDVIDEQPTVDAVPVVRCKDCKWRTGLEKDTAWHPCDEMAVNDNWFCADGERRDDE